MLETLTYTLVTCGVLFLVLPVMIYVYAKMATLGYYAGRDKFLDDRTCKLHKLLQEQMKTKYRQPTEPGDN